MNFGESLVSKLPDDITSFARSIRDTSRAEFEPSNSLQQKRTPKGVLFAGAESEIRTLEPCYRLHDFQSCALDQLGEFCVY